MQRQFLTVINRQFFILQRAARYEREMERQHLLRDSGQTTPVRENSARFQWRQLRGELQVFRNGCVVVSVRVGQATEERQAFLGAPDC